MSLRESHHDCADARITQHRTCRERCDRRRANDSDVVTATPHDWVEPVGAEPRAQWTSYVVAGVSLLMAASQFWTGRLMSAFDSGVYFGAASELVSGRLPYRDYVFVQPPGGLVLLSPWAMIGRLSTSSFGFEVARVASAVVVALVAVLVSRLLRPYGTLPALVAGLAVALAPTAAFEMASVKLESYCLLLCLLAVQWVLDPLDRAAHSLRWRLGAAGLAMGVAGSVKLWAFLPFVGLMACVWSLGPRAIARLLAWSTVGFALMAGPFALLAPAAFVKQVFVAQVERTHNVLGHVSTLNRLSQMTGLEHTPFALTGVGVTVVYATLITVTIVGFTVGGPRTPLDRYFLVSSVVTTLALLGAREFYGYYGYFLIPMVVGLFVTSATRIWRAYGASRSHRRSRLATGRLASTMVGVVMIAAVGVSLESVHQLSEVSAGASVPSSVARYIPPGSCVIFDDAIQGVLANRFVAASARCPVIVDAGGLAMALGGGDPQRSTALARIWRHDFQAAHYVVLAGLTPLGIPWTRELYNWFVGHFHVVVNAISYVIFRHD